MTVATESWDDVPVRDCYTKVQGQPCGPRHGWASWLNTLYVCPGTRTPGVAVAALDGDGRGVAAPTPPSPPVDTAGSDAFPKTLHVRFSDACTDVLVFLADKPDDHWPTPTGIAAAIAPPDAADAIRTVCNALQTLRDCGLVDGRVVDGWAVFRATTEGRRTVAEARAASQENAPSEVVTDAH